MFHQRRKVEEENKMTSKPKIKRMWYRLENYTPPGPSLAYIDLSKHETPGKKSMMIIRKKRSD